MGKIYGYKLENMIVFVIEYNLIQLMVEEKNLKKNVCKGCRDINWIVWIII